MEAQRIRTIVNLYAELKASEEQFKNIEPCFVEGNEYLTKLWTTQTQDAGSGVENPEPIEIPEIKGADDGLGEDEKKGNKGKTEGQAEGKGEGKGEGSGKGEGEGDGEEEGDGESKGKGDKEGDGESKGKGDKQGDGDSDKEGDGEEGDSDSEDSGDGQDDEDRPKFKIGDKVRVKSTGGVGVITDIKPDGTYVVGSDSDIKKQSHENISAHEGHNDAEGTYVEDELEPYKEDDDSEGQSESQQQPQTEQPEFEQEEEENPLDYKMKFPLITEMIYGVRVCDSSDNEQTKSIEKRLIVGIGVAICRSIMAESGTSGESVLSAKKDSYRGIFDIILQLFGERNKYNSEGDIINIDSSDSEEIKYIKELILADKFMNRILPMLTVFNKDLFNENQVDNAIDFCFSSLNEKSTLIVSERYYEAINEVNWGMLLLKAEDKKNYTVNYYRNSSKIKDGKNEKRFDKIDAVIVNKGKTDISANIDSMGDEFYKFIWALIFNYLNNNSQTIEQQLFTYRIKKDIILQGASNIFLETINNIERLMD